MKAAINFSYGDGKDSFNFKAGDSIPNKIASELEDQFILEKVAKGNTESLTRDQLMMLAGLGPDQIEDMETIEYDEDKIIETLRVLKTKQYVIGWFEEVHPDNGKLDMSMTREDMVIVIVEELTEDFVDEDEDEDEE